MHEFVDSFLIVVVKTEELADATQQIHITYSQNYRYRQPISPELKMRSYHGRIRNVGLRMSLVGSVERRKLDRIPNEENRLKSQ